MKLKILLGIVLTAALLRFLPHPPNMTPIAAIALFGGAYFEHRFLAFLIPFAALFLSDMLLGFQAHWVSVYFSFAGVVGIGRLLRTRENFAMMVAASVASSVLFFVMSNFSAWLLAKPNLYPPTLEGLVLCYTAAIPFFGNTLLGDLFYMGLLLTVRFMFETFFIDSKLRHEC